MSGLVALNPSTLWINYLRGKHKLSTVDSHTIHYGHLIDPQSGQTIEEVMVTVLKAPRTYTREDIVEVNCHGGIAFGEERCWS